MVEARTSVRVWSVRSQRPLAQGQFNFVEVSWDERRGLQVFVNLKLSGVDVLPQRRKFAKDEEYRVQEDRFLLGAIGQPFAKAGSFVLDNLEIWEASRNFLANWNFIVRGKKLGCYLPGKGVIASQVIAFSALFTDRRHSRRRRSRIQQAFNP